MGPSKLKLSKFVRRVIRPLTGCKTKDAVHESPVKSRAKNWASKSLRIFGDTFLPSNGVKDDDAPSFICRVPRPSGDQCLLSCSKDTSDWSDDKFDSVRLSLIHCAEIINLFPPTPVIARSQAMHPLHSQPSRPSTRISLSHDFSNEFDQVYGTYHPGDDTSWRALEGVTRRSSTYFPLLPSLMPLQGTPSSVSFDMPTGTRYLRSDSSPSYCESDRNGSPSDSFYSLSTGLTSTQFSQQPLGTPPLFSPRFTMPSCPNMSSSSNFIPAHLPTDAPLQDLSESRPSLSFSPSSPSSIRSATSRVPGLEHRAPRSLRRKLNPIYGSANPDEGHVPYGTIQF